MSFNLVDRTHHHPDQGVFTLEYWTADSVEIDSSVIAKEGEFNTFTCQNEFRATSSVIRKWVHSKTFIALNSNVNDVQGEFIQLEGGQAKTLRAHEVYIAKTKGIKQIESVICRIRDAKIKRIENSQTFHADNLECDELICQGDVFLYNSKVEKLTYTPLPELSRLVLIGSSVNNKTIKNL